MSFPLWGMKALLSSNEIVKNCKSKSSTLHWLASLDNENINNFSKIDSSRALIAAALIYELNDSVNKNDDDDKTPYDYAKMNKEKLPEVWKIMQAGKIIQDFQKRQSPQLSEEEILADNNAKKILREYANKLMSKDFS